MLHLCSIQLCFICTPSAEGGCFIPGFKNEGNIVEKATQKKLKTKQLEIKDCQNKCLWNPRCKYFTYGQASSQNDYLFHLFFAGVYLCLCYICY